MPLIGNNGDLALAGRRWPRPPRFSGRWVVNSAGVPDQMQLQTVLLQPHTNRPSAGGCRRHGADPGRIRPALLPLVWIALALTAGVLTAHGQGQTLRWIGPADEFGSPSTGNLAFHSVAGVTDQGQVVGFVGYFPDEFERAPTAVGWHWTPEAGFTYSPPSEATSPAVSALNSTPYPYENATQHGLAFYGVEPTGQILAVASDNRTESPGITSFFSRDPTTTHRSLRWLDGVNTWLPFVNHPATAADGMVYNLEQYDYESIWPGQFILGQRSKSRCLATNYVATPPQWSWLPIQGLGRVRFLLHPSGLRENYTAPDGWPEDPSALSVEGVNRRGRSVGVVSRQLPGSEILEWTGLYWVNPGQPRPISEVVGQEAVPVHITAAGEIVGVAPAVTEPRSLIELAEGRLFLWLPKPAWGLPAGLNWLTHEGSQARFTGMNERGMLIYQFLSGTNQPGHYVWSSGARRTWGTLLSTTNWTEITPLNALNGKGWVVCAGYRTDNGATDYLLSRPLLELDLVTTTNRTRVSQEFDLVATVRSYSSQTITNFAPLTAPQIVGETNAVVVGTADPDTPQTLPPGGQLTFRWRCRAIESGEARFAVQLAGNGNSLFYRTLKVTCDPVTIAAGDLLIKRAVESASQFGIDDEYQSNPSGAQVRTNTVTQAELSEFQVRLQNDDRVPRSFRLKIRENDVGGWRFSYLFNGRDISAGLRGAGMVFSELATSASHTVTVQMTPTNAVPNEPARVLLQLENPTQPGEILDIVEAVTEVASEIIVNSTGDEPDADVTDLYPDVDLNKPGLQTTLRCAMDFANRRAGADVIKFAIPATDPDYHGGIPRIRPATVLPLIQTPMIIDGWSQNPDSLTPPVEISGENANLAGQNGPAGLCIFNTRGCELRGLAIFGFVAAGLNSSDPDATRANGILLNSASECRVAGCHLGMDGPGRRAIGNDGFGLLAIHESDLNVIGGPTSQEGNLISGNGLGGIAVLNSKFNFLLHNRIGLNAAGLPVGNGVKAIPERILTERYYSHFVYLALAGIVVHKSVGIQVEDNRVAAQRGYGILFTNETTGPDNEARRNTIGKALASDAAAFGCSENGIDMIGDHMVVSANRIIGNRGHGIHASDGSGHHIHGNVITENGRDGISLGSITNAAAHGNRIEGNGDSGIGLVFADHLRIGIDDYAEGDPNIIINHPKAGVRVDASHHLLIAANYIGVEEDGLTINPNQHGVLIRSGHDNVIGDESSAGFFRLANTIYADHEEILITDERNRIAMNRFLGTWWPIDLGPMDSPVGDGSDPNDPGDTDQGGNTKLNKPEIISAVVDSQGAATLQVRLSNVTVGEHWIAIYQANHTIDPVGWPLTILEPIAAFPKTLLPQQTVSLEVFGGIRYGTGGGVLATLTDPSGNTSEMSQDELVQTSTDDDQDGMSDGVEALAPHQGDGNHDGTDDVQQANVTSFPASGGNWITLATQAGVTLREVSPSGPPDFKDIPSGYTFPLGLVSLTLSNVPPGGTVALTNLLHDAIGLTTAFGYGPTPDQPKPHWYELSPTIVGGEIRLTFTDGATGDHDQTINGNITTIYAPAYLVPPGPLLALLSTTTSPMPVLDIVEVNGQLTLTTNLTPGRSAVLTWPATASNYRVQTVVGLAPTNLWRSLPNRPVVIGDQLVVTHTAADATHFYRLQRY